MLKNGHKELPLLEDEIAYLDSQEQGQANRFAIHLLKIREDERKRLANDIHDKLGQNLLAMRIDVSMLHARTIDTHPRINSKADTVLGDLDVAIQNVRDIINHLRPPVLELGLLASVEWKVQEFERYSKVPCSLLINGNEGDYADYDYCAMPVMRILQESLTNVVRHANASTVDIALSNGLRKLTIKVADDGIGIHADDLKKTNAFGLLGVREYIRMLNGEFVIGSNGQQRGTVLTMAIPAGSGN
jgi:signal transduction histidine kinase